MKFRIILFGLFICLLWAFISGKILLGLGYSAVEDETVEVIPFWYDFFITCIWAPIWEEACYRYAPIQIARGFGKKFILPTIIMMSCYFGWSHGECHEGVFIQGGIGLILSLIYLKTNYLYVLSIHLLYNVIITLDEQVLHLLTIR